MELIRALRDLKLGGLTYTLPQRLAPPSIDRRVDGTLILGASCLHTRRTYMSSGECGIPPTMTRHLYGLANIRVIVDGHSAVIEEPDVHTDEATAVCGVRVAAGRDLFLDGSRLRPTNGSRWAHNA